MSDANLFFKKIENVRLGKEISHEEIMQFIRQLQREIELEIVPILNDIKNNKFKTFSVTKENPKMSMFIYGGVSHISLKIEKNKKEAEISIPRLADISLPR